MFSDQFDKIAEALAKAQKSFPKIIKDKEVKFGEGRNARGYKYADLAQVIEAITPALAEQGIATSQMFDGSQITTVLLHSSNQYIKSVLQIDRNANMKMQDFGAHITYLRRYALCALVGVSADEDDDVSQSKDEPFIIKEEKKAPIAPISRELAEMIRAQIDFLQDPNLESRIINVASQIYPHLKIKAIEDIPQIEAEKITQTLRESIAQASAKHPR